MRKLLGAAQSDPLDAASKGYVDGRAEAIRLLSLTAATAPQAASAAANVELFNSPKTTRARVDLSKFTQVRLTAMVISIGNATTAGIKLSYASAEASTWSGSDAGASIVLGTATAGVLRDSGWQTLAAGARIDNCTIAALTSAAFGTTAPTISTIDAYFR